MLNKDDIIRLRMKRQNLSRPVDKPGYDALFRAMSPVPTIYWCEPGSPPTLPLHTDFDDYDYNSIRRSRRDILKGRFAGGTIGYVTLEDLELFACLYRKEEPKLSVVQMELIELLQQEGPMNIGSLRELAGYRAKDITPALHKLQEAFLVYEDQVDNEWDRGWYLFESEFPEIDLNRYTKAEALKLLLPRAVGLLVFFDEELLRSYYRLPVRLITETVNSMLTEGRIVPESLEGRKGYLLKEDEIVLPQKRVVDEIPSVLMLQKNDFLVRAYSDELKAKFTSEWDSLYYLLIDGEFHGAVMGRFKFGPHVVEDIVLDLPEEERISRREEILTAVYTVFDPIASKPARYNGKPMK
jgi:hypothetical protein